MEFVACEGFQAAATDERISASSILLAEPVSAPKPAARPCANEPYPVLCQAAERIYRLISPGPTLKREWFIRY